MLSKIPLPLVGILLLATPMVAGLLLAAATAQQVEHDDPLPEVTWEDYGNGWISVNQKHSESIVGLRRAAITAISQIEKGSTYSQVVYGEKYDLVVIGAGASQWRVRCPDRETADNLCRFLIGLEDE